MPPPGSSSDDFPKGCRIVLCLVPRDLADDLHEPMREHFRDRPDVEVIVERRTGDRRSRADRRARDLGPPDRRDRRDRRRPRNLGERRLSDRRAPSNQTEPPSLPSWTRPFLGRLSFVERFEPLVLEREDLDTGHLVEQVQAGDHRSFEPLYERYFDRVYGCLRAVVADPHEADELVQRVFLRTLDALARYEVRGESFRAWLSAAVRDEAIAALNRHEPAQAPPIAVPPVESRALGSMGPPALGH